jgi:hypothetical protein
LDQRRNGAVRACHTDRIADAYVTVIALDVFPVAPFSEHIAAIGHVPGVVFVPTVHVHTTVPFAFAVRGPRPAALDGPGLVMTEIAHIAPGIVCRCASALPPRATGDVT